MHLDNVPEEYDGVLDCASLAICCAFNRRGSLLAVGCNDGRIVIWDFLTRGIAKYILAHANFPICSISWSRNSHKVVSASLDNTVAIWHVLTAHCLIRLRFPSPILKAQFNPRNDNLILVCLVKHPPILVEIDYEQRAVVYKILPTETEDQDPNITASFDRRGQHIYSGNSKGRLAIIKCHRKLSDNSEPNIISSFRIQTTGSTLAAIKEIEFGARNKQHFLVNSSDRIIRLYNCDSAMKAGINGICDDIRKFQDPLNRTMWRRCCFSGDKNASHVCGGSARQHALYIWETENGVIKKMLQGTKGELLHDVQWHPMRPIVASISSGLISIWARPQIENWSAFAPDFRELEENMEYDERESEFDEEDEDNHPNMHNQADVDAIDDVDVTKVENDDDLMSSDEDEIDKNSLDVIPITLDDYEMTDSAQLDANQFVHPKVEGSKETIDIKLIDPPIDEIHPLALSSAKRVRLNDKMGPAKRIPRMQ